jgi:transposase
MSTAAAALFPKVTVGLDLGDRTSHTYEVDASGSCLAQGTLATTRHGLRRYFAERHPCRVILEASTHSAWVARELRALGHEPVVANPAKMFGGPRRRRRNDALDAEFLARQGRADVRLLYPVAHRSALAQQHLTVLRSRDQLVRTRSQLITHVRGAVKTTGVRLRACSAEAFVHKTAADLPSDLAPALQPVLHIITELTEQIRAADRQIAKLIHDQYPVANQLQQPKGVGPLTALAFVLLIEDAARFPHSRSVGAYFGLVPKLDDSSTSRPQLRITKSGDELGRRLLVSAGHYILGPFGPDCDLRRHGEAIAHRGGKNARKRAVVAVARKLAVLLHRLWITGQPYDPNHNLRRRPARGGETRAR